MQKIDLPIDIEKTDKVSPTNPDFSWFTRMIAFLLIIFGIVFAVFEVFSFLMILYFPIEKEKEFFGEYLDDIGSFKKFDEAQLKTKINGTENFNIRIIDSSEVNAYATIGGNIFINRGLIENLTYEEELIFIIGHEMQHIKNRDNIKAILEDIPLTFLLKTLGFDIDLKVTSLAGLASSYNSKKVELKADNGGIEYVNNLGLNLECSANFFKNDDDKFLKYLNFVSSHPTNEKRLKNILAKNENKDVECRVLEYKF